MCILLQNGNSFFSFCKKKKLGGQNFIIFLPKKKKKEKKKILRPPDWPQFRPAAGQETKFFLRVAWDVSVITTSGNVAINLTKNLVIWGQVINGSCNEWV